MVTLQPFKYNNNSINYNMSKSNTEAKIKARRTKLSKKSKEELINIILVKDKEVNRLESKTKSLKQQFNELEETYKMVNKTLDNVIDENRYIVENSSKIQKMNQRTVKINVVLIAITIISILVAATLATINF